jgi:hypothetical protein
MAGHPDRAALIREFEVAPEAGDHDAMATAALGIAADRRFGAPLGRAAAYLHEAYSKASGAQRVRLAVELARTWVYGGEPARAVPFAREAVAAATGLDDAELLAAALDAELLVHWGPDDLAERLAITARLEDVAAHVMDVETRLSSHLWRLTTALESLDVVGIQRQLRLLYELAQESGSARVRMFAQSRRAMHALVIGDLDSARAFVALTRTAGDDAGEPDTDALVHELTAVIARECDDVAELTAQARAFEGFGTAHGIRSIIAEAATLWLAANHPDRARQLLDQLVAGSLAGIPRDVDWLLTQSMLTQVAAATGAVEHAAEALTLLTPYAGRGVVNAGGVSFVGVVDDYLAQACISLGRTEEARTWVGHAAAAYRRLGATGWLRRLESRLPAAGPPPAAEQLGAPPTSWTASVAHLASGGDGVWVVGRAGRTAAVREMRGFRYLRLLLERPGVELTALELVSTVAGRPRPVQERSAGEVVDRQALAAYRRRIADLDDELGEARAWADEARAAKLTAERGMLLDEVAAATGLGGRPRLMTAADERARVATKKSLAAAIRRIADVDPALGRLLQDTVRTGTRCCYDPDPGRPVEWHLDARPDP